MINIIILIITIFISINIHAKKLIVEIIFFKNKNVTNFSYGHDLQYAQDLLYNETCKSIKPDKHNLPIKYFHSEKFNKIINEIQNEYILLATYAGRVLLGNNDTCLLQISSNNLDNNSLSSFNIHDTLSPKNNKTFQLNNINTKKFVNLFNVNEYIIEPFNNESNQAIKGYISLLNNEGLIVDFNLFVPNIDNRIYTLFKFRRRISLSQLNFFDNPEYGILIEVNTTS